MIDPDECAPDEPKPPVTPSFANNPEEEDDDDFEDLVDVKVTKSPPNHQQDVIEELRSLFVQHRETQEAKSKIPLCCAANYFHRLQENGYATYSTLPGTKCMNPLAHADHLVRVAMSRIKEQKTYTHEIYGIFWDGVQWNYSCTSPPLMKPEQYESLCFHRTMECAIALYISLAHDSASVEACLRLGFLAWRLSLSNTVVRSWYMEAQKHAQRSKTEAKFPILSCLQHEYGFGPATVNLAHTYSTTLPTLSLLPLLWKEVAEYAIEPATREMWLTDSSFIGPTFVSMLMERKWSENEKAFHSMLHLCLEESIIRGDPSPFQLPINREKSHRPFHRSKSGQEFLDIEESRGGGLSQLPPEHKNGGQFSLPCFTSMGAVEDFITILSERLARLTVPPPNVPSPKSELHACRMMVDQEQQKERENLHTVTTIEEAKILLSQLDVTGFMKNLNLIMESSKFHHMMDLLVWIFADSYQVFGIFVQNSSIGNTVLARLDRDLMKMTNSLSIQLADLEIIRSIATRSIPRVLSDYMMQIFQHRIDVISLFDLLRGVWERYMSWYKEFLNPDAKSNFDDKVLADIQEKFRDELEPVIYLILASSRLSWVCLHSKTQHIFPKLLPPGGS